MAKAKASVRAEMKLTRVVLARRMEIAVASLALVLVLMCGGVSTAFAMGDANRESCPTNTESSLGFRSWLPDCRAYELVSAPLENGAGTTESHMWISRDGQNVITGSFGGFAGSEDNQLEGEVPGALYKSTRNAAGWSVEPLAPATASYAFAWPVGAGGVNLETTLWQLGSQDAAGEEHSAVEENHHMVLALRTTEDGTARLLEVGPVTPTGGTPSFSARPELYLAGASTDLSHVVFMLKANRPNTGGEAQQLWPGDTTARSGGGQEGTQSLYEYVGNSGAAPVYGESSMREPVLVGVSNEGPPPWGHSGGAEPLNEGAQLISQCGTDIGEERIEAGPNLSSQGAVSNNGESIFFTALEQKVCTEQRLTGGHGPTVNELYVRLGGVRTVGLSEPSLSVPGRECTGVCESAELVEADRSKSRYVGASRDGKRVFFMTAQPLVNQDTDTAEDLYMDELGCAQATPDCSTGEREVVKVEQLSHDPAPGKAAEVQGVVATAEDGSRVYFVAHGVLAANGNGDERAGGEFAHAREGAENMYVWEEGTVKFIAMLCTGHEQSGGVNFGSDELCLGNSNDRSLWELHRSFAASASPGGAAYLAFTATSDLTAGDVSTGQQVFEYHAEPAAEHGALMRASIGSPGTYLCAATSRQEEGYNCNGNSTVERSGFQVQATLSPHTGPAVEWSHGVAQNGAVVFEGNVALTPLAEEPAEFLDSGNPRPNVYEFRDGAVFLLSQSPGESDPGRLGDGAVSSFQGMDASGEDVFIQSAVGLVPQDMEGQPDVYDVRENGGLSPSPPIVPGGCGEVACGRSASGISPLGTAASTGTVNEALSPPRRAKCPRGRMRVRGKCVKRGTGRRAGSGRGKHRGRGGKHKGRHRTTGKGGRAGR